MTRLYLTLAWIATLSDAVATKASMRILPAGAISHDFLRSSQDRARQNRTSSSIIRPLDPAVDVIPFVPVDVCSKDVPPPDVNDLEKNALHAQSHSGGKNASASNLILVKARGDNYDLTLKGATRADLTNSADLSKTRPIQTVDVTFKVDKLHNINTTKPGEQQIIWRMLNQDPCNFVLVKYQIDPWRDEPEKAGFNDRVQVHVKKNSGKKTLEECGEKGFNVSGRVKTRKSITGEQNMEDQMVRVEISYGNRENVLIVQVTNTGDVPLAHEFDIKAAEGLRGGVGVGTNNVDAELVFEKPAITGQLRNSDEHVCKEWLSGKNTEKIER